MIYTGAAPNQQAIPAVDYLMNEVKVKRWVLEGTDYVYPRTTNKILEAYLKSKGVAAADIIINYTPFGFSDWTSEVSKIKAFGSTGKKTAVVSTINGDANVPFYKELGNQKISAENISVVASRWVKRAVRSRYQAPRRHLAAWNYFESVKTPLNTEWINTWHAFTKKPEAHLQRSDGSARARLPAVGEGGREGQVHRCGQGAGTPSSAWKCRT